MSTKNHATQSNRRPSPEMQDGDDPLFFYMPDTRWGEFCQWFPCTFTVTKSEIAHLVGHDTLGDGEDNETETITFNCAEQFMMYCKAARFRDLDSQSRILATPSPKQQKALGKAISGFDNASWDEVKSDVVVAGNVAKFGQNGHLRNVLLGTGQRLLVEAASKDRVWGIGYTEKHALKFRKHWGENRLGRALMRAREQLREQQRRLERPWEYFEE